MDESMGRFIFPHIVVKFLANDGHNNSLEPGADVAVDLSQAPIWSLDTLVFRVRGAEGAGCRLPRSNESAAQFRDGTSRLAFHAPRTQQRFDVVWDDQGAGHVHEVEYEVSPSAGSTAIVDLSYETVEVRLRVNGLTESDMLLLRSRGAVDAPHCRSHVARLHTAGQDGALLSCG